MDISNTEWAWPWWYTMVIINIVNLIICGIVYKKSLSPKDGKDAYYRKRMRIMGVIFTLVGAYRSVFVSRYHTQQAWFDTIANSSLIIRTLAMFAELSFAGLVAYAMLQFNKSVLDESRKSFLFTKSPYVLMYSIFFAQFFAYGGTIIKFEILWAIEETLWFIGFLSITPLAISQLRQVLSLKGMELEGLEMLKSSSIVIVIWCIVYIAFALFLNLPGYWESTMLEISSGFPVIQENAFGNAFSIVNVTREYSDWGFGFLFWHSAYFSVCVWLAIFLMQGPRALKESRKVNKKVSLIFIVLAIFILIILLFLIS